MANAVPPIRWKDPDADFLTLKDALLAFIAAHGRSGYMPTEKDLRSEQRDDLVDAIEHFGGFSFVAERLALEVMQAKRKPSGYWDDINNLAQELQSFNERYGIPGMMPRQSDLIAKGRADIMNACQKHGGLTNVAQQLGLERFDPKKIKSEEQSLPVGSTTPAAPKRARKTAASAEEMAPIPAPVAAKRSRKAAVEITPVIAEAAPAPAPVKRTRKQGDEPVATATPVLEAEQPQEAPKRSRKPASKAAQLAVAEPVAVAEPASVVLEVVAPTVVAAPVEAAQTEGDVAGVAVQSLPDLPAEERPGSGGFVDRTLTCRDCGTAFVFTASMQVHYAERGWTKEPQRCRACFQAHKEALQDRRGPEQRSGPPMQGGQNNNRRPPNNRDNRSGPPQQGFSHGRREPHQKPTYRTRCRRCGREMFTSGGTPYCTNCSDRQRRP